MRQVRTDEQQEDSVVRRSRLVRVKGSRGLGALMVSVDRWERNGGGQRQARAERMVNWRSAAYNGNQRNFKRRKQHTVSCQCSCCAGQEEKPCTIDATSRCHCVCVLRSASL